MHLTKQVFISKHCNRVSRVHALQSLLLVSSLHGASGTAVSVPDIAGSVVDWIITSYLIAYQQNLHTLKTRSLVFAMFVS